MATFKKIKFGDGLAVTDEGAGVITVAGGGGPAGPPGPSGATTFLSGTGAPTAGVGTNGAIYLDTATGKFYGPKAGGVWPSSSFGKLLLPGNTYADVLASYTNYAGLLAG